MAAINNRDTQFQEWAKLLADEIMDLELVYMTRKEWEKIIARRVYDLAMFIVSQAFEGELKPGDLLMKNGKRVLMYPENLKEWFLAKDRAIDVQIDRLDGSCPVQAIGKIEDHSAFYFRGRHEQWQFVAGPKELSTDDLVKVQLKMTQDDRVFVLEGPDEDRDYLDYNHVRNVLQDYAKQYLEWMERKGGH